MRRKVFLGLSLSGEWYFLELIFVSVRITNKSVISPNTKIGKWILEVENECNTF